MRLDKTLNEQAYFFTLMGILLEELTINIYSTYRLYVREQHNNEWFCGLVL